MTIEEKIIDYIDRLSRGMCKLKQKHAEYIVKLVQEEEQTVEVSKWRYNGANENYDHLFTHKITATRYEELKKLKDTKQYKGFYLYKFPDFQFHTVNPNLL